MNFRATFCDPFNPEIIELGDFSGEEVINKFNSINWSDYLHKIELADEDNIHYSPSLEIENKNIKYGLVISAVGNPNHYEFYIFYKRPRKVKSFLGLITKHFPTYTSDKAGQTRQDALDCINALIRNDNEFLENKIGK